MADLSDVTNYLAHAAASAVYPNGTGQPSVANMDVRIYEGWPNGAQLDLDLGGQMMNTARPPVAVARPGGPAANVSVYPMNGSTAAPFQILDNVYTLIPPVFGLTLTVTGVPGDANNTVGGYPTVTIAGQPAAGEYVTLIVDRGHVYSATGVSTASIIAQLVAQALPLYPGTTSTGTTITVPASFDFTARQGAPGTLAKVTHRQHHEVMLSIWAPNHTARATIAAAIDVALKSKIMVALSDTSAAKVCYSRTNTTDEQTLITLYRRDLIYEIEYATLQQFPGYVITSTTLNVQAGNWGATTAPPIITGQDRPGAPFPLPVPFLR